MVKSTCNIERSSDSPLEAGPISAHHRTRGTGEGPPGPALTPRPPPLQAGFVRRPRSLEGIPRSPAPSSVERCFAFSSVQLLSRVRLFGTNSQLYEHPPLLIHSTIGGHLSYFQFLLIELTCMCTNVYFCSMITLK